MLSDLIVLELASVLAGPSIGQFFAELGATVIKVENSRTQGDVTRRWKLPTEAEEADLSSYFASCNWGKRSVALDLRQEAGREIMHALAQKSDIVIASYKPGDAEKLHADYATLKALNPRLLYGHITGYGVDDPRPGYDAVIQAESGFMYINGAADGPPVKMPVALMDVLAAHQLKEALLLGLLQRARTGEGAYFTVSLIQAAASALVNQATNWLVGGTIPQRTGSEHPNIVPYGTVYRTRDNQDMVLAVGTDRQFATLCTLLELSNLAEDPRFKTNYARVQHRTALNTLLQERIGQQQRDDLLTRLASHNIPAGAVNDMQAVFKCTPARTLALLASSDRPAGLRHIAFETPEPIQNLLPPPHYAEHTAQILKELLCLEPNEIHRLAATEAVYLGEPDHGNT